MPEKFQLNRFDVTYRYKDISFKTYIDYYKYMKFFERYKEQKKEMKRTEIQANLIKELQRDLAAKQKENDQWVKEKTTKMKASSDKGEAKDIYRRFIDVTPL